MPGRIRIKIPAAKGNPLLLEKVRDVFSGINGLQTVRLQPDAGSIVLVYDPKDEASFEHQMLERWKDLANVMPHKSHALKKAKHDEELPGGEVGEMARKIEVEAEYLAGHSHSARILVDFFKDADQEIKRLTDNHVDLKIVLALALAVATFIQIGAHAATPMWVTLALFALNHFLELQRHDPEASEGGPQPAAAPAAS